LLKLICFFNSLKNLLLCSIISFKKSLRSLENLFSRLRLFKKLLSFFYSAEELLTIFILRPKGSKNIYLYAVLPVSTSQAKRVWSACASLRGKLRCVHRAAKGRCGAVLDTLFNERSSYTKIQSEALIERLRDVAVRCLIRSLMRGRHTPGYDPRRSSSGRGALRRVARYALQ
jgi:hypothetical protein